MVVLDMMQNNLLYNIPFLFLKDKKDIGGTYTKRSKFRFMGWTNVVPIELQNEGALYQS